MSRGRGTWHEDAACRGLPTNAFYGEPVTEDEGDTPIDVASLRWLCRGCPVRKECLADALAEAPHNDYGWRAGTTAGVRTRLRKGIQRKRCPSCASEDVVELYPEQAVQACSACGISWPYRPLATAANERADDLTRTA